MVTGILGCEQVGDVAVVKFNNKTIMEIDLNNTSEAPPNITENNNTITPITINTTPQKQINNTTNEFDKIINRIGDSYD